MPDTAWYDSSGGLAQAMLNQVENPFETDDNTIETDNPELKAVWDTVTGNVGDAVEQELAVGRRLDRLVPERRLRHDGLPGLDARRHRGQRRGRRGLGHRRRVPRRRRQLGRLLPDRPRPGRQHRGGQGGRRLADRPRAAGQGVPGQGHLPEPGRGAVARPRSPAAVNPFFNDAPIGEILANRAAAVTVQPHKGPKYSDILQAFQAAVLRVDDGSQAPTSRGSSSRPTSRHWAELVPAQARRRRHPEREGRLLPPAPGDPVPRVHRHRHRHPAAGRRLTRRQRLSPVGRALRAVPLHLAVLRACSRVVGLFPLVLHRLGLGPRVGPAERQGRVRRPPELPGGAGRTPTSSSRPSTPSASSCCPRDRRS